MPASPGDVPRLFEDAERGVKEGIDALYQALYRDLHRLARAHLHGKGGPVTLSATTLLHEAYLELAQRKNLTFPNEGQFLSYASRAMRGLIVDYVRQKNAVKRGGDLTFSPLDETESGPGESAVDLENLSQALDQLGDLDSTLAELVDLKFFCGFSFAEIARLRGVSERTIQRDWVKAKIFLSKVLNRDEQNG